MYPNLDRILWIISIFMLFLVITAGLCFAENENVKILSHSEGGLISGPWALNVTVVGPIAGIRMSVDGGNPVDLASVSPDRYSMVLNTTSLDDGEHSVLVEAYDGNGSIDQALITLEVDNTPPVIEVDWPVDVSVILPFPVNVTFFDIHSNGSSSWVEVINGDCRTFPLECRDWGFQGIINISNLNEGSIKLAVVAVDGANNYVRSESKDLRIKKLPDLTIVDYKFDGTDPRAPGDFYVSVRVRNQGYRDVEQFEIALYIDDMVHARRHVEENLKINKSIWVTLKMHIDTGGRHIIMVILNPDDSIEETDLGNNIWKDEQRFSENSTCLSSSMVVILPLIACLAIVRGWSTQRRCPTRQG